jgi:hypothetical protein
LHAIIIQDLVYGIRVEIAQHIGITSTTGFDIALRIDMQAAPWGSTIKIRHAVFTAGLLAPGGFGFAVVFSSKTIGN